ncbi:MAG: DUF1326 domain-containing protein [Actinomycetota bacterium]
MSVPKWNMKGSLLGICNCDWGCPCNFDARPSKGFCDGAYTLFVKEGKFGDVDLAGVKCIWAAHAPGAVHEGNLTVVIMVDDKASSAQRDAILTLWKGGGVGLPFDVFASVTSTWLDPVIAPIEFSLNGINSTVKVAGGSVYEAAISRIKNPVTGDVEELYLDKPTGFTSLRSELGMSIVDRMNVEGLTRDNSGQYAEYAEFSYAGP